jgi:single-strand DNA-binding protein
MIREQIRQISHPKPNTIQPNHTHPMSNLNKVILIGRLTCDPVVRHTAKGVPCADISLAINRHFTSESGEKREETTFVDITLWGKTAELTAKYLNKGSLACVEGRLKMDSWTDKANGQARSKLGVIGDSVTFLESSSNTNNRAQPAKNPSQPISSVSPGSQEEDEDYDWNSPF